MKNVKETYTNFHLKNKSSHLYPTEWVIRTMLGSYPKMKIDKSRYVNAKILDIGFGDARNMPLLNNIGLDIYGVETTEDILALAEEKLSELKIKAELKVGKNNNIPFSNSFFDIILSCASCYYIDEKSSFEENMKEYLRVLKKDGLFIANFPEKNKNFICQNCLDLGDGNIIIQNDLFNLRNGYKFRVFETEKELKSYFEKDFYDISIGYGFEDYYGLVISAFYLVAYKK